MSVWGAVAEAAGDLVGKVFTSWQDKRTAQKLQDQNYAHQKEFAQQGVRWRVADAKAAGLHPLAALGSNTLSFSPQQVGHKSPDFGSVGQNIGRAIASKLSADERVARKIKLMQEQQRLRNMELTNQSLKKSLEEQETSPALPMGESPGGEYGVPGQGDPAKYERDVEATIVGPGKYNWPSDVVMKKGEQEYSRGPGVGAGNPPAEKFYQQGGYMKLYLTQEASEPMESSWYDSMKYGAGKMARNLRAIQWYRSPNKPEAKRHRNKLRKLRMALPIPRRGWEWRYNPFVNGFKLQRRTHGAYGSRFYEKGNIGIPN